MTIRLITNLLLTAALAWAATDVRSDVLSACLWALVVLQLVGTGLILAQLTSKKGETSGKSNG